MLETSRPRSASLVTRSGWRRVFRQFQATRFWRGKLIMLLLVASLLSLTFFYSGFRYVVVKWIQVGVAIVTPKLQLDGVSIENATMVDQLKGGRLLQITAASIIGKRTSKDLFILKTLWGEITRLDDQQLEFQALNGILDNTQKDLFLSEQVELLLRKDLLIKGDDVHVNTNNLDLQSVEPVIGVGSGQEFQAEGFATEANGNIMRLNGVSYFLMLQQPKPQTKPKS